MPTSRQIELSREERSELEKLLRRAKTPRAVYQRAQAVMLCAQGESNVEIAERLGVSSNSVCTWRGRFASQRLAALFHKARSGAPRLYGDDAISQLVKLTLESKPRGATHWSRRLMADKAKMSPATIGRIWRAFGLKPHLSESFTLSTDPMFVDKVKDIVGL
jgi:transposase